jgi:hypothetical protein
MNRSLCLLTALFLTACAASESSDTESSGTIAFLDTGADLSQPEHFFDFPFPSDIRLTAAGTPDMTGFPNPKKVAVVSQFLSVVGNRKAFPVVPVGYFRFNAGISNQDAENVIPASKDSPVLLVDVDEKSPERGRLFPTVAATPAADDFAPEHLLAVAPRPGFILSAGRQYAFVVQRSFGDENGKPLGVPYTLRQLRDGKRPSGSHGKDLVSLYAPLWATLKLVGIPAAQVAAATVFTTGDVVADMAAMSDAIVKKYSIEITDLHIDPVDGADHDRYCEFIGKVSYPQFQTGKPPFNTGGLFVYHDGVPELQRQEVAPITITLPKTPMPAAGYPLMVYFHGSGGVSGAVVDRGRFIVALGMNELGKGPAYVLAPFGIAAAGSALPVNPERVPGAGETEYLNLGNVAAFPDTFHQGALEQRLFIKALKDLTIPQSALAACTGPTLPAGATAFKFAPEKLVAQGQSMGGMYTNMIGAIEPRIKAVVPTGAGGYWSYFILKTSLIEGADKLLGLLLNTKSKLTFMHPVMSLMQIAWESVDPIVYMPRLARDPLPGHPVRPIYEPVGKGDSYFPTVLYDAVALAYHHQEMGDEIWPSMQEALKLDGLDGIIPYPVRNNSKSLGGVAYTGAIVQYEGDGEYDPHALYTQLDTVKYQYGCFFDTFLRTGTATILKPKPLGSACE